MSWRSVKCPYCGDENPRDKNYCGSCGKPLSNFQAEPAAGAAPFIPGPRLKVLMDQEDELLWYCRVECKLETHRVTTEGEAYVEEWAGNEMALTRKLLAFFRTRRKGQDTETKVVARPEVRSVREAFTWWPGNMKIVLQMPQARWKIQLASADGEKILELLSKSPSPSQ